MTKQRLIFLIFLLTSAYLNGCKKSATDFDSSSNQLPKKALSMASQDYLNQLKKSKSTEIFNIFCKDDAGDLNFNNIRFKLNNESEKIASFVPTEEFIDPNQKIPKAYLVTKINQDALRSFVLDNTSLIVSTSEDSEKIYKGNIHVRLLNGFKLATFEVKKGINTNDYSLYYKKFHGDDIPDLLPPELNKCFEKSWFSCTACCYKEVRDLCDADPECKILCDFVPTCASQIALSCAGSCWTQPYDPNLDPLSNEVDWHKGTWMDHPEYNHN